MGNLHKMTFDSISFDTAMKLERAFRDDVRVMTKMIKTKGINGFLTYTIATISNNRFTKTQLDIIFSIIIEGEVK